jgi:hypothetical protein
MPDELLQLAQIARGDVGYEGKLRISRVPTQPIVAMSRSFAGNGGLFALWPNKQINPMLAPSVH